MITQRIGAVFLAGTISFTVSGCGSGPEPSFIAPVAISIQDGSPAIAFCEEVTLSTLRLSQEVRGWDSDFEVLFEAEINSVFDAGEVIELQGAIAELDRSNRLANFTTAPGTSFVISAESIDGSGFTGVVANSPDEWPEGWWLPTEAPPSEDPCEFWDGL